MAAKTGGKSISKGKASGQTRQSASRKQTTGHKGQGSQNKGAARAKERSGKEQSQTRRQKPGESQDRRGGGKEQQGQQSQQNQPQSGVARRAAQSVKRHPVKAAVIAAGAAGAGVMLVKGLRKAISSGGEGDEGAGQQGAQEDDEEDGVAQASDNAQGDGEEDSEQEGRGSRGEARNGITREAYQRGREAGISLADDHPLLLAAAALLTGAAVGWLLPSTRQEDHLIGSFSDKVAGNLKKSAADIISQGQKMLSRAISEGADTLAQEAEREGLTPQRLGRKFKRMAGHVREAVGEAIEL